MVREENMLFRLIGAYLLYAPETEKVRFINPANNQQALVPVQFLKFKENITQTWPILLGA